MDEETADNCFNSIDPKFHENLYFVDNSKDGFAHKYGVKYEHHPENIGISRSWNIGVKKVIEEQLDYLVIMSATIIFEKGMSDLVHYMIENINPYGLETQHVWHLMCLTRRTLETVGYFDENFYPAYYEDSDYIRRMELAGIHNPMSHTQRIPKIEISAGYQGNAHAMKKAGLKVNMGACRQAFIDKWGHEPRYETQRDRDLLYKYPYNNPKNDIKFWHENDIPTLMERYELIEEIEEIEEIESGEEE